MGRTNLVLFFYSFFEIFWWELNRILKKEKEEERKQNKRKREILESESHEREKEEEKGEEKEERIKKEWKFQLEIFYSIISIHF